jgi:hypothetical protein
MKRSNLLVLAVLAMSAIGAATISGVGAVPATAPFGCDARAGQTCFFKILYGPRATRIVQLRAGMKVNIPGIEIGRDKYCESLGKPPPHKCAQKLINANYNN